MSYSVDWAGTKEIFIPEADLVLVEPGRYQLVSQSFLEEIRRLEWDFYQGLGWPQILQRRPAEEIAGIRLAPVDKIINGYSITFDPNIQRVDLVGSNNNIVDVLNPNGVVVVPSNSVGLQVVSSGSGLSSDQASQLNLIHSLVSSIEGSYDIRDTLRLMLAVLTGELSGAEPESNTISMSDLARQKPRVVATVDEHGNRANVTLDATD